MKDRLLSLGDGIISIILTIMVFNFPSILSGEGNVILWGTLGQAVLIYFISFCFLANLWFQITQAFDGLKEIRNKQIVLYLFLLFCISLIPSFTNLVVKDPNREVVFLYGLITLWISIWMEILIHSLTTLRSKSGEQFRNQNQVKWIEKHQITNIFLRIILLVFAYFFTQIALWIYLILPIAYFLENIVEREEEEFLTSMGDDGTDSSKEGKEKEKDLIKEFWKNPIDRYIQLIRSSMDDEINPKRRFILSQGKDLYEKYVEEVNHRIDVLEKQIPNMEDGSEKTDAQVRLDSWYKEQKYLSDHFTEFQSKQK